MLLMRRFLRENTCKTQLGAKFGARRVKSMFRYCINVGERVMMCRGLSLLTFTVYHIAALENCTVTGLTMVYVVVQRGVEGYSYSLVENGTVIYS